MKIAMVSEHANPLADFGGPDAGGQNVHVAELSAALTRLGHDVTVYTRRDGSDAPTVVSAPSGYRVQLVNAGPPSRIPKDDIFSYLDEFADELFDAFLRDRPDVVHAHFWMSALASILSTKPLRLPVVVTFHALGAVKKQYQGADDTSPASRIAMETVIARHADAVIATSTEESFALIRMGTRRNDVTVIPCGVDVDTFATPAITSLLGTRSAPHLLCAVGRLVARKGFDVAIDALTRVDNAELVIVGGPADGGVLDDPEGARLNERAEALGVADRVRLLGRVSRTDMPSILQDSDLVLCTPWYEPFGMVPLEAMSAGTPVVASAVGGLRDTVRDGLTGDLVAPRNPAELAGAVGRLLADPARRRRYAQAGTQRVRECYTWSHVAHESARVYSRVADEYAVPAVAIGRSHA